MLAVSFSRSSNHKSRSNLNNYSNSTNFELASTAFETGTNWTQADGLSTVQQAEAASGLAWPFALVYASVEIAFLSFLLLSFAALAQQAPCTADSSTIQVKS